MQAIHSLSWLPAACKIEARKGAKDEGLWDATQGDFDLNDEPPHFLKEEVK